MRVIGLGALTVEQRVVHVERRRPARLQHLEGFAVVLGADHEHVDLVIDVVAFQEALVGGAGGGHHVLAAQVSEALDPAVLRGQQLAFDVDEAIGERHLLLPFGGHAGGAALQVHGAVLHQWNAGLRGHQVVLHLQVRQRQLLLDALDDLARQIHRVTHRLAAVITHVGERHRSIAIAQGDAVGAGDLAQGAGQRRFIGLNLTAEQQAKRTSEQRDFLHCYSPLWVLVYQTRAAMTVISTSTCGRASSACTVVRLGACPGDSQADQTSFIAAKSSVMFFR
ncbi:hypothetical protein D3C76_966490 [compost metagenome]